MGDASLRRDADLLVGPAASTAGPATRRRAAIIELTGARGSLGPMFVSALVIRVAFLTLAGRYVFRPDFFGFGWETGRVARALATGRGFSDPFHGATGPTAWLAPLYPMLLAGIFKLCGVYSRISGWTILTFNSVCSALTAVVLYGMGVELYGERMGRRTGWAWALSPYAVYWPTRVIWDTSLTALLLALVVLLTLRLARHPSWRLWAAFGLAWGCSALTNPAPLAFAPVSWTWACLTLRRRGRFDWRPAAMAGALSLACVAPWLVRNDRVFGRPVFIRGNFGVELRLGNNPESLGLWTGRLHPTQNPRELDRYRQMGEVAYVRAALHEATAFIESHPSAFLANTLRRVYWFWCGSTRDGLDPIPLARNFGYASSFALTLVGLGMLVRSRRPEASLFLGLLSLFPLVYYLTFTTTRYRHPIEPEMQLLMVYALTTCSRTSSAPRRQSLFVSPSLR